MRTTSTASPSRTLLPLSLPILLHLVLQIETLGRWWSRDDPCILASISRHGVFGHFFDSATWKSFSPIFFAPMQVLSLGVDYYVAGLEPAWFFAHQLCSGLLFLCVAFLALRWLGSPWMACLALCMIVTSSPFFAVSQQLMNRHYLEGLLWVALALLLFLVADSRRSIGLAVVGASCFLLAALSKEVFVPLVLIFPFFLRGRIPANWRILFPYAVGVLTYAVWRLQMLGFPNIRQVYPEPGRFPGPALLGLTNPTSVGVWLLVLGAACFMLWWKSKKAFWVSVATLFLAFLTLLPVLGNLQPRHLLVPIVAFSIAVAAGLSWWRGASRWRALAGIGLVVFQLSVLPSSPTWDLRRELSMYRSEGGFLMTGDPEGRLLTAIPHSHFLACLHRLRKPSQPEGPSFCGDRCWCQSNLDPVQEWEFVDGKPIRVSASDSPCSVEKEMRVLLILRGSELEWEFGPYAPDQGTYFVILLWGHSASVPAPVRTRGRLSLGDDEPLRIVVRFDALDGWTTYSDILEIGPSPEIIEWSR